MVHGGASQTIKQYKYMTVEWAWLLCCLTMMRHFAVLIHCICFHTEDCAVQFNMWVSWVWQWNCASLHAACGPAIGWQRQTVFWHEGACLSLAESTCAERKRTAGKSHRICESRLAQQKGPSVFLIHWQTQLTLFMRMAKQKQSGNHRRQT